MLCFEHSPHFDERRKDEIAEATQKSGHAATPPVARRCQVKQARCVGPVFNVPVSLECDGSTSLSLFVSLLSLSGRSEKARKKKGKLRQAGALQRAFAQRHCVHGLRVIAASMTDGHVENVPHEYALRPS